jgi:biotin carboxyl carrier protein
MNRQAKIRLFFGILILAIICFGLFLYFNSNEAVVSARSAQLHTQVYDVGAPYSGQITHQFVHEGDQVKEGQKMFYLKSTKLQTLLKQADFNKKSLKLDLTKNKQLIIDATKPGMVQQINKSQGSFVPENTVIATVAETKDLHVTASFHLTPDQFAMISKTSNIYVTLPSARVVKTSISDIKIVKHGNQVIAKISGDLNRVKYNSLTVTDGTPVNASLKIREPLWKKWGHDVKQTLHL